MKSCGFTLIELMIVVSIIGILAVVAVPSYIAYIDSAAHAESNIILPDIIAKEKAYKQNWGVYITVNSGYLHSPITGSGRKPQLGNGTQSMGDAWSKIGYAIDNSTGGGVFGGPVYNKYAFNSAYQTACSRRLKPSLSSDKTYEYGVMTIYHPAMRLSNERTIQYNDGTTDEQHCPRAEDMGTHSSGG